MVATKKLGLGPEGRQGILIEVATQFFGYNQKFGTDEDRRSPQRLLVSRLSICN